MKKKEILIILLMIFAGLILYIGGEKALGFLGHTKKEAVYFINPEKTDMDGTLIPSFNILLSDSSTVVNVGHISDGKPTVLFYFGPQCPYCRLEMKEIIKNIEQLKDIQFYIFTPAPFGEMKSFSSLFDLKRYSNIKVGVDYEFFFSRYFKTESIPYLAIYGKDRKLKGAFVGVINSDQIIHVAEIKDVAQRD